MFAQAEIAEQERQAENLELFIEKARKYEGFKELAPYALLKSVTEVYVVKPDKSSEKNGIQYDLADFAPINELLQKRETAQPAAMPF